MGLASDAGNGVYVEGLDGKEYVLPVLTMKQIAELSALWMGRLRDRYKAALREMGATIGQQLAALRDFEQNEPSFIDTCQYAVTAAGIDDTLAIVFKSDVSVLGDPWRRREIASQLVGLTPINPKKVEALPDPLPESPTMVGG